MTDKYEAAHSAALDLMLLAEEETEAELRQVLKKTPTLDNVNSMYMLCIPL